MLYHGPTNSDSVVMDIFNILNQIFHVFWKCLLNTEFFKMSRNALTLFAYERIHATNDIPIVIKFDVKYICCISIPDLSISGTSLTPNISINMCDIIAASMHYAQAQTPKENIDLRG